MMDSKESAVDEGSSAVDIKIREAKYSNLESMQSDYSASLKNHSQRSDESCHHSNSGPDDPEFPQCDKQEKCSPASVFPCKEEEDFSLCHQYKYSSCGDVVKNSVSESQASLNPSKSTKAAALTCTYSGTEKEESKIENYPLDHFCFFCRAPFVGGLKVLHIFPSKALPRSALDPLSLLSCFGIEVSLEEARNRSSLPLVAVCERCYVTISECDLLYPLFCSLISKILDTWVEKVENLKLLSLNISFQGRDACQIGSLQRGKNVCMSPVILKKRRKIHHPGRRKLESSDAILKFNYMKNSYSSLPKDVSKLKEQESDVSKFKEGFDIAEKISVDDVFSCGFCGLISSSEESWSEHALNTHKIGEKWLNYDLQIILKGNLFSEIKTKGVDLESERHLKGQAVSDSYKCYACNCDFHRRLKFIEHLNNFHCIFLDECDLKPPEDKSDPIETNQEAYVLNSQNCKQSSSNSSSINESNDVSCGEVSMRSNVQAIDSLSKNKEIQADHRKEIKQKTKTKISLKKVSAPHWRCRLCGMIFSSQNVLTKHKHQVHPESTRIIKRKHYEDTGSESDVDFYAKDDEDDDFSVRNLSVEKAVNLSPNVDPGYCVVLKADGQGGVVDQRIRMEDDSDNNQDEKEIEKPELKRKYEQIENKSFTCGMCAKEFSSHILIAEHSCSGYKSKSKRVSEEVVLLECNVCKRRLQGVYSMRTHMARAHGYSHKKMVKKHRCKLCSFKSQVRSEYLQHMKEKHKRDLKPPVKCNECGKKYSAQYIDRHVAIIHGSSDNKKYSCKFCSMKYHDLNYLKRHIYFDHANTKWKCQVCDMEFDKYHRLQLHRVNVHGTEVHKCSDCDKTFKRKGDLTAHVKRSHATKVPSACSFCPKAYMEASNLRMHLMKKHGIAWENTLSKRYARHQQESNCLRRRTAKDPKDYQESKKRGRRTQGKQDLQLLSKDEIGQSNEQNHFEQSGEEYSQLHVQSDHSSASKSNIEFCIKDELEYDVVEITVAENNVSEFISNSDVESLAKVKEIRNTGTESCIVIEAP